MSLERFSGGATMLQSLVELKDYTLLATDGSIGQVQDFYLDVQAWTIRYLVVDTGEWLSGRRVLLSPTALKQPNESREFPVSLTKKQVENSPDIDTYKPVSRQQETELHAYYDWPLYWDTGTLLPVGAPGPGPYSILPPLPEPRPDSPEAARIEKARLAEETSGDPHLHSANEVIGYYIQARDGDIGHIDDFIIDDETWTIQYIVVDTHNWLPGKKVEISPHWVKTVSWTDSTVEVDLLRETVENSPEYETETVSES
jgi:sporulation protein YlmC with PRC-barrel domain